MTQPPFDPSGEPGSPPDAAGLPHGANQPGHIYGGAGPAGGPYIPPNRSSSAVWVVLLLVLVVPLMLCGGCLAVGMTAFWASDDASSSSSEWSAPSTDEGWTDDSPAPLPTKSLAPGARVSVGGIKVLPGWRVTRSGVVRDVRAAAPNGTDHTSLVFRVRDGAGRSVATTCPVHGLTDAVSAVKCSASGDPDFGKVARIRVSVK